MPTAPVQTSIGSPTSSGILFFVLILLGTLAITYWAAKRTKSTQDYLAAGRSISALQNGFALAGDYMSAAAFLGITGMCAMRGFDGLIYATGPTVGWPILMFLLAEPLRNLGKYTFADVVALRLRQRPVRVAAAFGGVITLILYTITQMVGAGSLIKLMFGVPYEVAEIIVGAVMLAYVLFGGMIATTWVQIIKAVLLLGGSSVLFLLTMNHFNFNFGNLFAEVSKSYGQAALEPGGLVSSPLEAVSMGLAMIFGVLGLPHILMRFYTVPNAKAARVSVSYATGLVAFFFCIIPIVGYGASVMLGRKLIGQVDAGGNMAAPLLAELLGGTPFLGFISAVAFATILAVVAGLTLASASAISHDIYFNVFKKGQASSEEQMKVAKIATVGFGLLAMVLGIFFKGQNVAYMVTICFAVAASANFPALFMSIVWRRFTTQGAVWSIIAGTISAVGIVVCSPTVWVAVLHNASPIINLNNPAIVSMPLAFLAGGVVSLLTRNQEEEAKFDALTSRRFLGVGAE
ncbi:MAG: sodium/solute symporter [Pseudomonadota bacterium]